MRATIQTQDYGFTTAGIFKLAYDRLIQNRKMAAEAIDDAERMIYTGRCQAYSEMLSLATGRPTLDKVSVQILQSIGVTISK